ncbi:aquaporin-8 isoform X1 [Magallana gigas]|uniref:aquaporin-8 isoform X1 n=1 Tax=Magallana gigas TaxID=29159 RepID=UPI0033429FE0
MSESEILVLSPTDQTGYTSFYKSHVRPMLVEFIGTTILVFLVCMTSSTDLNILVYGFATVFLIASFGDISGGHFNPAITLGCTVAGALSIPLAVCYFFAQILGGMLGAAFTRAVYPEEMYKAMVGGSTFLKDYKNVKPGWGVMTEALLTFIIVLTFLHSLVDKKSKLAPLSVGLTVAVCSAAGSNLTGGSMNPARSFGPTVAVTVYKCWIDVDIFNQKHVLYDGWEYHYIYWVGPIAGALFAALIYRFVLASVERRIHLHRP